MSDIVQPTWTDLRFSSREQAIASALEDMEDGDSLTIHQDGCVTKFDAECDCAPEVRIVAVGRA